MPANPTEPPVSITSSESPEHVPWVASVDDKGMWNQRPMTVEEQLEREHELVLELNEENKQLERELATSGWVIFGLIAVITFGGIYVCTR